MSSMKNVSDGYHTFGELYEHRTALFAALCNTVYDSLPNSFGDKDAIVYKSKLHSDGTMFDDMFLATLLTKNGWVSYHCKREYWDWFHIPVRAMAMPWDGHTSEDVITRLTT